MSRLMKLENCMMNWVRDAHIRNYQNRIARKSLKFHSSQEPLSSAEKKQIENEKVDGDYVLSKEVTLVKAAVLFDTSVGLTSATVEVTDNAYETFAKTIDLEEEASNYTKEQLETKVTVETSHVIGQLNFTYGEQAKPQIDMMELLKYSTIDVQQLLGALISGGGTPLPGSRKE